MRPPEIGLIGRTDWIGQDGDDQRLSERRAEVLRERFREVGESALNIRTPIERVE